LGHARDETHKSQRTRIKKQIKEEGREKGRKRAILNQSEKMTQETL
jgi:hypothetical protein